MLIKKEIKDYWDKYFRLDDVLAINDLSDHDGVGRAIHLILKNGEDEYFYKTVDTNFSEVKEAIETYFGIKLKS